MGLSASQGRLLLLTARRSDLEFRAQQISQKRLVLSQQLEEISTEYEEATSNRQMKIDLYRVNADGETVIDRTANLTYAYLVSGTTSASGPGSELAGIKSLYETPYTSSVNYRLMSIDGAIVISDEREIPMEFSKTQYTDAAQDDKFPNLYKTTKQNKNNTTTSYSALAATGSALSELFTDNAISSLKVQIDKTNGFVQYTDDEGKKTIYDINSGEAVESTEGKTITWEDGNLYKDKKEIPQSSAIVTDVDGDYELDEGADGVWTVKKDGAVVQRYIVDKTLKYGSTDASGGTSGPNYLQDCLRNGKYMLQKCIQDENIDDGWRWSNISWDATSDISDTYYTEDDEAAKAKYDRLQTQIQAQDKKLELELDNIETQRNAVTTEVESVEKVISDDIEGTFNAFG